MNRFWQWLVGIDSRGLFRLILIVSLVCFAVGLHLLSRTYSGKDLQLASFMVNEVDVPRSGETLITSLAGGLPDEADNVFVSEYKNSVTDFLVFEAERMVRETAAAAAETNKLPAPSVVEPEVPVPESIAPEPMPAITTLATFQGMMTRPDGTRMALIATGDAEGPPSFVAEGSEIVGYLLIQVNRNAAWVKKGNEDVVTLSIATPVELTVDQPEVEDE